MFKLIRPIILKLRSLHGHTHNSTFPSSLLFSSYILSSPRGPLELTNRIVVAPMCQYSANNGEATDWHLMHWGNLLNSGAALFIIEATGVSPEARISPACLGLWDERTEAALKDKLSRARALAPPTPVFIQLAPAGRKASSATPWNGGQLLALDQGGWNTVAPSAIAHLDGERLPHELTNVDLEKLIHDFVAAARRADRIGVDGIEIHGAHGYLIHEFLSPIANQRTDQYGGSFENRVRFPLELFAEVRGAYKGVLGIRISASDWIEGGWTPEETAQFAALLKHKGCDYVHISSGGISPKQKIVLGPKYQVPFAKIVKDQSGLPTMAVGLITDPHQAEEVLEDNNADFVALARAFLYKPRWGWEAAAALGGKVRANERYWRSLPKEAQAIFGNFNIGAR